MKNKLATTCLYAASAAAIFGWWYCAFKSDENSSLTPAINSFQPSKTKIPSPFSTLATINREVLHQALSGDIALMAQLIADWDVDAQLLGLAGQSNVKRLSRHQYLRSQILGRQLLHPDISSSNESYSPRMLPQTYAAASFVLALTEPDHIVALPKGLREQKHLFSQKITNQIPLDINRYNAETLYLAKPEIAFIAHYSHPSLVQSLKNQGTELITLLAANSIDDIHNTLIQIGDVINRSLKAELLSLFMEAAMQAIDNRLLLIESGLHTDRTPPVLFVNYHSQFSVPTARTLTGQILKRMGVSNPYFDENGSGGEWVIPINKEQITNLNPQCLIIAAPSPDSIRTLITHDPAMGQLAAVKDNRIYFVDEAVQQFPSQYLVLAYYDIAQALLCAYL